MALSSKTSGAVSVGLSVWVAGELCSGSGLIPASPGGSAAAPVRGRGDAQQHKPLLWDHWDK